MTIKLKYLKDQLPYSIGQIISSPIIHQIDETYYMTHVYQGKAVCTAIENHEDGHLVYVTVLEPKVIEEIQKIDLAGESDKSLKDLELGYSRYEKLRKLNANEFTEIYKRNLGGENFDKMIDEL